MSYWNAVATVATGAVDELHVGHAEQGRVTEIACNHHRDDWTLASARDITTTDVCISCPRQQWTSIPGITGIDHVNGRLEFDTHGYEQEVLEDGVEPRQDARTDGGVDRSVCGTERLTCPHGCGEMVRGVQGDPLEPEEPYCTECGHIDGHDCDDGCRFVEPTFFCRSLGHNIQTTLRFTTGRMSHRCVWCGHHEYVEKSSSRETRTGFLQTLADPIVRYLGTATDRSDDEIVTDGGFDLDGPLVHDTSLEDHIIAECPRCLDDMLLGKYWKELIVEDGHDIPVCPDCEPDQWTEDAEPKIGGLEIWALQEDRIELDDDADPDVATDGGIERLRFADEYVQSVLDGEKTATVRYDADLPVAGDRVSAVTESGTEFATLEVKRRAGCLAVEVLSVLEVFGVDYDAADTEDLLDGLNRHYEAGIRPGTPVEVLVFEVVKR